MRITPHFLLTVIFPIIAIIRKMRTTSDPNLLPNRGVCGSYRSSSLQADLEAVFCYASACSLMVTNRLKVQCPFQNVLALTGTAVAAIQGIICKLVL